MLGALKPVPPAWLRERALTLIELMLVIAVAGVLIALAAPGLRDFILLQRLKSVNAQLVTDLQFARSEAAARQQLMRLVFRSDPSLTCYSIYTSPVNATRCDCRLGVGAACSGDMREVRTVLLPVADGVRVAPQSGIGQDIALAYDPVSGGIVTIPTDDVSAPLNAYRVQASIDAQRILRTTVGRSGRLSVCAPASSSVGAPPC